MKHRTWCRWSIFEVGGVLRLLGREIKSLRRWITTWSRDWCAVSIQKVMHNFCRFREERVLPWLLLLWWSLHLLWLLLRDIGLMVETIGIVRCCHHQIATARRIHLSRLLLIEMCGRMFLMFVWMNHNSRCFVRGGG